MNDMPLKRKKLLILAGVFGGLLANVIWKYVLGAPWGLSAVIPGLLFSAIALVVVSLITYNPENPPAFFEVKNKETADITETISEEA